MNAEPEEVAGVPLDCGLPIVCGGCGQRMQQIDGHRDRLPCAGCYAWGITYCVMVHRPGRVARYSRTAENPLGTPFMETCQLERRAYHDYHFPERRAYFWWTCPS